MSALNNKTEMMSAKDFQAQQATSRTSRLATKKPYENGKQGVTPTWALGRGQQPAAQPTWAKGQPPPRDYDFVVGIDPGVSTGIAMKDVRLGLPMELLTLDFWRTTDLLLTLWYQHGERLVVFIEDPNVHKSLYADKDKIKGEARVRLGQNVGANKREASLLIAYCQREGIRVEPTKPLGKLSRENFEALTGITHGSQHARDAGRIIFNK